MPRTTTVHLLTGDYPDRLAELVVAAQEALKDSTPLTAIEEHPYTAIIGQHKALKAEAIEAGVTVNLAALGRTTWRRLKEKHPPRTEGPEEAVKGDRSAGVNADTVEDDLIHASVTNPDVSCAGDMRVKTEPCHADNPCGRRAAFDEWSEDFSEGEWQVLVIKAWELTNGARLDPKDLPPLPTPSEG